MSRNFPLWPLTPDAATLTPDPATLRRSVRKSKIHFGREIELTPLEHHHRYDHRAPSKADHRVRIIVSQT
jgi:hypothetical protein